MTTESERDRMKLRRAIVDLEVDGSLRLYLRGHNKLTEMQKRRLIKKLPPTLRGANYSPPTSYSVYRGGNAS